MLTCGHHQASARPIQTACEQAGMGDRFMKISGRTLHWLPKVNFCLSILIVRGEATTRQRGTKRELSQTVSTIYLISSHAFRERNSRARVATHVICLVNNSACKRQAISLTFLYYFFFHHNKWDSINARGNRQVAKNGTGGLLVVTTSGDWRFAKTSFRWHRARLYCLAKQNERWICMYLVPSAMTKKVR